jgi:hypothetical protein
MTHKERMLSTMHGEPVERVEFAPRMDLWYIANRARGTLPDSFMYKNMAEVADELAVACHAVRADFTLERPPESLLLRGLGLDNHPDYPFRVEPGNLEYRFEHAGTTTRTEVTTRRGRVRWEMHTTREMSAAGISLPFIDSYPVESVEDLDAVTEIFNDIRIVPTPENYAAFAARVGDRGVAVANGCIAAGPMHLLLHSLMPMDLFFYLYHDEHSKMCEFCENVMPFFHRLLEAMASSPAEVLLYGGNFDRDLTWPPFFREHLVPHLRQASSTLAAEGKLLLCHTDGENAGLLELYRDSAFKVAESVCPAPMSSLDLRELRRGFGAGICLWGGIPSVMLLPDSVSELEFDRWLDTLAETIEERSDSDSPLILGVSDNVPPDADLQRIEAIARRVAAA